jgi:hypothetical protein
MRCVKGRECVAMETDLFDYYALVYVDFANAFFDDSVEGYLRHSESGFETILPRGRSEQQSMSVRFSLDTFADEDVVPQCTFIALKSDQELYEWQDLIYARSPMLSVR